MTNCRIVCCWPREDSSIVARTSQQMATATATATTTAMATEVDLNALQNAVKLF